MPTNVSLDGLDTYINSRQVQITEYTRLKEGEIFDRKNYVTNNITINQIVNKLTSNKTIDAIKSQDATQLQVRVNGEHILEHAEQGKFEHGDHIDLCFTNYLMELSPTKIILSIYGSNEKDREFFGEKASHAYVTIAYVVMNELKRLKEVKAIEKEKSSSGEKEEDDLPF